jgi:hypothetical protein
LGTVWYTIQSLCSDGRHFGLGTDTLPNLPKGPYDCVGDALDVVERAAKEYDEDKERKIRYTVCALLPNRREYRRAGDRKCAAQRDRAGNWLQSINVDRCCSGGVDKLTVGTEV